MHLELIRSNEELEHLANEWNDLLTCCSASHVPFLRHEYLSTWWSTMGGGEWQKGQLSVITAREASGELTGIAPLFFTDNLDGVPALMLLGSIEISDYLDMIIRQPLVPEFIDKLLDYLDLQGIYPWQLIDLYNVPEDSPSLSALQRAASKRGWAYTRKPLQHCPYIPLPGDWETYLASIDKKQRHEIRRKMRRAQEYATPVSWYIVDNETRLDAEVDDFLSLMAQDPDKAQFLTGVMRSQMRAAVHAAFRAGWLQLAFLQVGQEKVAGYLNFDYAKHIWVYNSGLNFDYRELSPGWVLLGYLIQWANDHQRSAFDFMRGNEDYKYRFGAIDRMVVRATIQRPRNSITISS